MHLSVDASPPAEIGVRETLAFLEAHLQTGTRILEVGCGDGLLAAALGGRGFTVRGIDVDPLMVERARNRDVDALEADFLACEDDPFDVILFSRSLHHLHPLEKAMERTHDLLRPGGTVLVEDFGVDLADAQGAYWRYAVELFFNSIGVLTIEPEIHSVPRDSLRRWQEDHAEHDHPISESGTLRDALATHFAVGHEERCPYFYRYILQNLETSKRGLEMGEHVLEWERGLIAGGMSAVGIRWVARP